MYTSASPVNAIIFLLVVVQSVGVSYADDFAISGVIGMSPVESHSCIGVWVPLSPNEAIEGIRWFNNDDTILFPKIYLSGGDGNGPGYLLDAIPDLELVQGESSAWSEVSFTQHYASAQDGVYVIFQLPYGSVKVADGEGGGAGVGYYADGQGLAGWLTLDGADWLELHPDYSLAVAPILVERDAWVVNLERVNKSNLSSGGAVAEEPVGLSTVLHPPRPNPFNPQTKLRFMLKKAGIVDLEVFDLKGKLVKVLASRVYSAGEHELTWSGCDGRGREVASGVYLAKMTTMHYFQTHRLVLVR